MSKSKDRRILCVFAHPDDECYGPGGTIAHYALLGVEVSILMFTCGEAGSIGVSKTLPRDELCRRRRSEFAASCAALGVRTHRIVGVPDGSVGETEPSRAVAEILADIERYRPQVAITFHHQGVSGHPDHIAVANFLDAAFEQAGPAGPLKVYQWGIPWEKASVYERPGLRPTPDEEVHARITPSPQAMDRKLEAIRSHDTQYEFYLGLAERFDFRAVSSPECFTLRKTRLESPADTETDLFAGVL